MKILSLTSSEEQLMLVIWNLETAFMKDIMTAYPEPKPHQNTVSTFLKILVEKNYLKIEKKGRIFKYIPKINFEDYRKFQLENLLEVFYYSDINLLLKDLKVPEKTTEIEEKSIAEIIEETTQSNDEALQKDIEILLDAQVLTLDSASEKTGKKKKEKKDKEKKEKKKNKHKKSDS